MQWLSSLKPNLFREWKGREILVSGNLLAALGKRRLSAGMLQVLASFLGRTHTLLS